MPEFHWEESSSLLREAHQQGEPSAWYAYMPSLLISETMMRWNDASIGNYRLIPQQFIIGGPPYSRLLILQRIGEKEEYLKEEGRISPWQPTIGSAISSIMSFVLRCRVISYNRFPSIFVREGDTIRVTEFGKMWAEIWDKYLDHQRGLRSHLRYYVPNPEEEQNLVETINRVYAILMKTDEELYHSLMGALRLYQLALLTAETDYSLAYSLLASAVDAASSGSGLKVNLRDVDPEGKLEKLMEEFQFDKQLQRAMKNCVEHHETLTRRFSNFIVENLPNTFWEGDYSMTAEYDLLDEQHWSGQYERDLSRTVPEPMKQELLRRAEKKLKEYEELKKQRPKRQREWIFNKERRKWMINYLRGHLDRVLANTFGSRSELFHLGRGFPKRALTEGTDWIPDVFEEDFRVFIWEHLKHKWNYRLTQKGKIIRSCSCGDKQEVKVIFGIRVFERMVHDSILSYLLKLNET